MARKTNRCNDLGSFCSVATALQFREAEDQNLNLLLSLPGRPHPVPGPFFSRAGPPPTRELFAEKLHPSSAGSEAAPGPALAAVSPMADEEVPGSLRPAPTRNGRRADETESGSGPRFVVRGEEYECSRCGRPMTPEAIEETCPATESEPTR